MQQLTKGLSSSLPSNTIVFLAKPAKRCARNRWRKQGIYFLEWEKREVSLRLKYTGTDKFLLLHNIMMTWRLETVFLPRFRHKGISQITHGTRSLISLHSRHGFSVRWKGLVTGPPGCGKWWFRRLVYFPLDFLIQPRTNTDSSESRISDQLFLLVCHSNKPEVRNG